MRRFGVDKPLIAVIWRRIVKLLLVPGANTVEKNLYQQSVFHLANVPATPLQETVQSVRCGD